MKPPGSAAPWEFRGPARRQYRRRGRRRHACRQDAPRPHAPRPHAPWQTVRRHANRPCGHPLACACGAHPYVRRHRDRRDVASPRGRRPAHRLPDRHRVAARWRCRHVHRCCGRHGVAGHRRGRRAQRRRDLHHAGGHLWSRLPFLVGRDQRFVRAQRLPGVYRRPRSRPRRPSAPRRAVWHPALKRRSSLLTLRRARHEVRRWTRARHRGGWSPPQVLSHRAWHRPSLRAAQLRARSMRELVLRNYRSAGEARRCAVASPMPCRSQPAVFAASPALRSRRRRLVNHPVRHHLATYRRLTRTPRLGRPVFSCQRRSPLPEHPRGHCSILRCD